MIVVAAFDKQETILQQLVCFVEIIAEKRAPRFGDDALFHFAPHSAQRFAHLAVNVLAVRLNFGNLRAHHVGLLAVLEEFAAPANPFLAFHQDARKLVAKFRCQIFQERQLVQNVGFDRLLVFCPRSAIPAEFRSAACETRRVRGPAVS